MNILLFGNVGQLGWELHRCLAPLGEVIAVDYPQIDLSHPESVRDWVRTSAPNVIINATAYTAVDKAESEPELAMAINAYSVRAIAEEAERQKAAFIHFSTDYVFDGRKGSLYVETDKPNPLSVYGESKLAGERFIQETGESFLIFRTSWVYSLRRDSFVSKVLAWAHNQPILRVVDDQIGNPTWARMLAEITAQLLAKAPDDVYAWVKERKGIYHLAGSGACSRLEWAQAILKNAPEPDKRLAVEVQAAKTSGFPTPAQRPLYSALDCEKFNTTFGLRLPPWQDALKLAMAEV